MAKLRELKKIAIPVLAIYKPGDPQNPIVLEDILTESQVLQALEQVGPSTTDIQSANAAPPQLR
jgi:hypothetical protein